MDRRYLVVVVDIDDDEEKDEEKEEKARAEFRAGFFNYIREFYGLAEDEEFDFYEFAK